MHKLDSGAIMVIGWLVVGLLSCTGGASKISDEQIVKDSLARLRMDAQLDADSIHVESKNNIVTLTGHVAKLYEKYLAESIVGSTRLGIRDIINEINVITPAVDDRIIADDIRNKFEKDPLLGTGIKVEVVKGVVYLTGTVKTASRKKMALEIASRDPGVVDVVSNLEISPERITDAEIANEVNTYLRVSPLVKEGQITVSVKDGVVHLSGEVEHLMRKVMLNDIIGNLRGVVAVKSDIQVK